MPDLPVLAAPCGFESQHSLELRRGEEADASREGGGVDFLRGHGRREGRVGGAEGVACGGGVVGGVVCG